jgi:hypothetical protein
MGAFGGVFNRKERREVRRLKNDNRKEREEDSTRRAQRDCSVFGGYYKYEVFV